MTAQLDLFVEAAEILERPVTAPPDAVAGAIESPEAWMRHESLRRERGLSMIADGQSRAADPQLARYTQRCRLAAGLEHEQRGVRDRLAQWNVVSADDSMAR